MELEISVDEMILKKVSLNKSFDHFHFQALVNGK